MLDLGLQPEANRFLRSEELDDPEPRWPLHVGICERCWLLQLIGESPLEVVASEQGVGDVSPTMRAHRLELARSVLVSECGRRASTAGDARAANGARGSSRASGSSEARVAELASHGGYLQRMFAELGASSIVLEPDPATAAWARSNGFDVADFALENVGADDLERAGGPWPIVVDYFRLAHVPQPDSFVRALALAIADGGFAVLEFDHVLPILVGGQFDAIRHGHYSYLSLTSVSTLLERHGLRVEDAVHLQVFGGSLRIRVGHGRAGHDAVPAAVRTILEEERDAGIDRLETYATFARRSTDVRADLVRFIEQAHAAGRSVVAYGAPSRGSTLLNWCGVTSDVIRFASDASAWKVGRFMPGTHIPIVDTGRLRASAPDDILILPWDLADEITRQLADVRAKGTRLVLPLPKLRVLD